MLIPEQMSGRSGFLISSDRSDSGKTTVALGLMRYFSKNYKVSPFKVGPDFIDPMFHKIASGNPSVNLDLWIMGKKHVQQTFKRYGNKSELSIIEGVMGFYDGIGGKYSTWELSRVLNTPVILVIDCSRNSTTASAIIRGLKNYRKNSIMGVIFNNVASVSHYNDCKLKLPNGIDSLGWIPYEPSLKIGSRHLGLLTPDANTEDFIRKASDIVEEHLDTGKILEISEYLRYEEEDYESQTEWKKKGKVAVAYDDAFSFYYHDNLEYIQRDYEIEFFSPLRNEKAKDPSFIYLGGGYPELFAGSLQNNRDTKNWLLKESDKGTKILGECGGMMYLSKNLNVDRPYEMTGIFDIDISMGSKITIGYTELRAIQDSFISKKGSRMRGHEFHKSVVSNVHEERVFKNIRGKGIGDGTDGFLYNNTVALYSHSMFRSSGNLVL